MKFKRFSTWGPLSNWGYYDAHEQKLLDLELEITKIIKDNEWMVEPASVKPIIQEFLKLQAADAVEASEMAGIEYKLREIKKTLTELLAKSPTFPNHHPDALVGEIQTHLAHRKQARFSGFSARVIHYQADLRNHRAANFHAMLGTGQRVLWTLDVDGYLSIGDPLGNKHSVIAVGHTVKGAGTAQLKIDPKADAYFAMKDQYARASGFEVEAKLTTDKAKAALLLENAKVLRGMGDEYKQAIGSWTPPANAEKTVVLDFDSGHYAPREAWRESTKAWNTAGYKVVWSPDSKFV
jgi:hypothetical protein